MSKTDKFSDETIAALKELGAVYQQIHNRLMREGYVIRSGKIYPPGAKDIPPFQEGDHPRIR